MAAPASAAAPTPNATIEPVPMASEVEPVNLEFGAIRVRGGAGAGAARA